jgi:hypothetical protein
MSDLLCVNPKVKDRTIVRLTTTFWHDQKGAYCKKGLTVLKRKSFGENVLLEECSNAGSDMLGKIINFWESRDGVYEIIVCNVSRDWETGYVDGWELKLVPFDV